MKQRFQVSSPRTLITNKPWQPLNCHHCPSEGISLITAHPPSLEGILGIPPESGRLVDAVVEHGVAQDVDDVVDLLVGQLVLKSGTNFLHMSSNCQQNCPKYQTVTKIQNVKGLNPARCWALFLSPLSSVSLDGLS